MVHALLVDVSVDMKGIPVVQVCDTGDYFNIYLLNLNIYALLNRCDTKELEDTRKITRVRNGRRTNNTKKKTKGSNNGLQNIHIRSSNKNATKDVGKNSCSPEW
jgi:IS30 family transposase